MSSSARETTRVCLACGLETQEEIANCPNDGSLLAAGADPLVGTIFLEKYQITKVLGRGGMSAVYKAKHLMMDRYVAIKFLRSELVHDNIMLQRFQLESKAVSLLKHPNIITVHDFGVSTQGIPYLIMDFLEGKTVADLISEFEFLEPARCVNLFKQICNALTHTHNKGVIHRDIKPSNLIVSIGDDGQEIAQVVDFGIAKMLESEASSASKLTASGEVFGSPAYMSPEQCNGSAIDARTDIYALGCVIYNCLTGRPPLLGRNAMETVLMHVRDMPKSFGEIRPDLSISPVLERVVFKALAKDPEERFASMSEFGAELAKSLLESNNNTTWVIPSGAQKALQDNELAQRYEHTVPIAKKSISQEPNSAPSPTPMDPTLKSIPDTLTPNAPPSSDALESSQPTQNIRPDAIQPNAELGNADPVVILTGSSEYTEKPVTTAHESSSHGRMNPNAMIMPGSDLFGYDSLKPALPDQVVVNKHETSELRNNVDDIPLAAPPRLNTSAPTVHPPKQMPERFMPTTNPAPSNQNNPAANTTNLTKAPNPTTPSEPPNRINNPQNSISPPNPINPQNSINPANQPDPKLILVLGIILAVLIVFAILLILVRTQQGG